VALSATWKGDVKFTDEGSYNVFTQPPAGPLAGTLITTQEENPRTSLPRDLCLTIGLSRYLSSECGDLRVSHPLPPVRTINKIRQPALIYNSATAHPYPAVIVTVNQGSGTPAFDSVEAKLKINGFLRRRASWTGASLPAGTSRQLVLTYDALNDPTGMYNFGVEFAGFIGGIKQNVVFSNGQLVVVNRSASPFGAGWWVAGVEQLFTHPDSSRILVGGDGSTRRYVKVNNTTFVAEAIEFPDTLKYTSGPPARFTRYLPGGTRVQFDNNGYHVATVDRLGYTTTLTWTGSGAATRLQSIAIPPSGSGLAYTFVYDANARLDSVVSPPMSSRGRGTQVTLTADGRIQTIRDPDNHTITFGHSATILRLITSRTDKRGTVTTVSYDSARKVAQSTIAMVTRPDIVYQIRNRVAQGLNLSTGQAVLVDTAVAYTHLDGPRQDVADTTVIWLDRFGGPRRIRNSLGHQAVMERKDTRFPGLVTGMMAPNGFWRRGGYDNRGNLIRDTLFNPYGTGQNPVTQYAWDPKWDMPTQITRPLGDGVTYTYDVNNGNRLTQADGRGAPTTVTFRYGVSGAPGLLSSIVYPVIRTGEIDFDSLAYDVRHNVQHFRTATTVGGATTITTARHYTSDNIGQVGTACVDLLPATGQQCVVTQFDIMSRDSVVTSSGPATAVNPAQTLTVRQLYDPEGNRLRLERSSSPDIAGTPIGLLATEWGYDRAHRPLVEIAPDGLRDSSYVGAAGTIDSVVTRRQHRIRMSYNVLGQMTSRTLPTVEYPQEPIGLAALPTPPPNDPPYPRLLKSASGGLTIAGETVTFTYDSLGNIVTANNADARIARTYWPGGALRVETQRVRSYEGSNFDYHVYPVGYRYDLNGRLETLRAPAVLTNTPSGIRDSVRFTYMTGLGGLQTVTDPLGNVFTLGYDLRQQLDSLFLPGQIRERFRYDGVGRVVQDSIENGSAATHKYGFNPLRKTTLRYDGRDKITNLGNSTGARDTLEASYSGLGQVERTFYKDHGTAAFGGGQQLFTSQEIFKYDAMGNVDTTHKSTDGDFGPGWETWEGGRKSRYYSTSGRLLEVIPPPNEQIDTLGYDPSGNEHVRTFPTGGLENLSYDRVSYFDSEQRLRVVDYRVYLQGGPGIEPIVSTFEEHRYDALGRRVLVRTRRACNNASAENPDCGIHLIRRTVWHGVHELMEIQMPGHDTVQVETLENDSAAVRHEKVYGENQWLIDPNPFYGRVYYTPGVIIDQPLAVTRWGLQDSVQALSKFERYLNPFTIVPHWNVRGQADMGTFADGSAQICGQSTEPSTCLQVVWPFGWTVYQQRTYGKPVVWHGSILDQKREGSALIYRRKRFFDPASGRFTQEDRIRLRGGVNLYGYSGADPVNHSDPMGDSVRVIGLGAQAIVNKLRATDTLFRRLYDKLDADPRWFHIVSTDVVATRNDFNDPRERLGRFRGYTWTNPSIRKAGKCGGEDLVFALPEYEGYVFANAAATSFVNSAIGIAADTAVIHESIHNLGIVETGCPYEKGYPLFKIYGPIH
jgi:RHS repeat-associated protein